MTLVEQVWKKLDEDMAALMQPGGSTDFVALKARLRAFAEVLAIFMTPHFNTADEVAREAKRRYQNRHNEDYETPGLNSRRYEPPPSAMGPNPDWYNAPDGGHTSDPKQAGTPAPRGRRAAVKPAIKLNEKEQASIKLFHENGFSKEQLAKTYGVGIAVIDAVLTN